MLKEGMIVGERYEIIRIKALFPNSARKHRLQQVLRIRMW